MNTNKAEWRLIGGNVSLLKALVLATNGAGFNACGKSLRVKVLKLSQV